MKYLAIKIFHISINIRGQKEFRATSKEPGAQKWQSLFEGLFPLSFSRIELSIFFLAQVLGLGLDNILSESDEELKIHGF